MKKSIYFISVLLAVAAISFTSCNQSEADTRPYTRDLGTVTYAGVSATPYIQFDYYGLSYPMSGIPGEWQDGDRILAYFYIEEQMPEGSPYAYKVDVREIGKILVKDILEITTPAQDTLGTDYFYQTYENQNGVWIGGGYLNLGAFLFFSQNSTNHQISLASYKPTEIWDGADTIHLVLKHKSKNNERTNAAETYTSFHIDRVLHSSMLGRDSVTFAVKIPVSNSGYGANVDTVTSYATYKFNNKLQSTQAIKKALPQTNITLN